MSENIHWINTCCLEGEINDRKPGYEQQYYRGDNEILGLQADLKSKILQPEITDNMFGKFMFFQGNRGALVEVRDNGPGIDSESRDKIFIPFFTTKKHGTGVGLSLSQKIMRLHQGNISVSSQLPGGTTFTLRFQNYRV